MYVTLFPAPEPTGTNMGLESEDGSSQQGQGWFQSAEGNHRFQPRGRPASLGPKELGMAPGVGNGNKDIWGGRWKKGKV